MNTLPASRGIHVLVLLGVSIPFAGLSQIQGSVKDINNQPVANANVILMHQKDSSMVSGILASDAGTFSIYNFTAGTYILGMSMVGFKPAYSAPFDIKTANDHLHLSPIIMEEDLVHLQGVDIVAKKPIYELQIDRMVINVENSITSTGNTALEVLEKSPGVIVDRQNNLISMNGKSGVMIIINGRQTRMPVSAAVEMLAAMNADNIKKIELITSPPAKYDADGNAGIINIILKKNDDFGTNGTFSLGAGMGVHEKLNGSLSLNHHVEKVNYFGSYNASHNMNQTNINASRLVNQPGYILGTSSESLREGQLLFQNARAGLDYTISSKTTLGVLAAGYIRDWKMDAVNDIFYRRNQQVTSRTNLITFELSKWSHYMGNINLEHHFKEDEILDLNFDYLHYENNNPSNYKIINVAGNGNPESGEAIDVTKSTPINIGVATVDYTKKLGANLKVDGGLKATLTRFSNDVSVSYLREEGWQFDEDLTNKYKMDEDISAVYANTSFNLDKNTSIIAGMRYEYMNSVLSSATEEGILDLHYGKLFPTFYFSRKFNNKHTWQFSYSKRIDRPTFNELAPWIIFMTPETYVSGNENLVPAISNILKTEYLYKSAVLSFTYTDIKNEIARFQPRKIEDENKQYLISRNLDRSKTISVILAFPVQLTEWWKMQNNIIGLYKNVVTEYDGQDIDISQANYNINSTHTLTITKSITAELSGFYQSRSLEGIYKWKPYGRLNVGIQKKFKDEKSTLSFNVTDVFKTNIYRSTAYIPELNINTNVLLDFEPRVARLTYTYNFGNTKAKSRERTTGSEEERSRINTN